MTKLLSSLLLALFCVVPTTRGQLAITEVMSSAANTFGASTVTPGSDFFELSNFGPNPINLTGYKWTDDTTWNPVLADPTPFMGVTIQPGESLIVMYTNATPNEAAFRAWWGASAASVRVLYHNHRGFSASGDSVRLWDANDQFVDAVDFLTAVRGRTFTYHPVYGSFGWLSTNGVGGAFNAATADDVGSPGRTTGAVPITIMQQPTNTAVNAGNTASLSVSAFALPRLRYQWLFNNAPLAGQTSSSLVISNAQAANAGSYRVVLTNGVMVTTSAVATLSINGAPVPPQVTLLPRSQTAYEGQTVTFSVAASGNPAPQYQWRFKGVDLPFETNPQITLYGVMTSSSGAYSVVVSNSAGVTNVSAQLTVTTKPRLVITEVMASEGTNAAGTVVGQDWWELSNQDTFAVNLMDWRWDDDETRSGAFVITNDITIRPGESIIFVESLIPEEFRSWWGGQNLSPELQIIRYTGNGLNAAGEVISLWNAAATDDSDRVASATFGAATAGVSFGYNPSTGVFGGLSLVNQYGAFPATSANDVGSPGLLWNRPVVLTWKAASPGVELMWSTRAGVNYALRSAPQIGGPWTTLTNKVATGVTLTVRDSTATGVRFYRVVESP